MNIEIAPYHTEKELSYENALLYCFMLKIDDKVGWRIPTYAELVYIHDKLDNDFSGWYLSSKINHINGSIKLKNFSESKHGFNLWVVPDSLAYIRPVRTIK